jgi:tetratricopeptide (TPR) repeat protein
LPELLPPLSRKGWGDGYARPAAAILLLCATATAFAAPFIPKSDSDVVERLPASATDPSIRRVDSLRKQLAARPGDVALRLEIARRYFDLAMAQGDPRYVGYASAAIGPLAQSAATNASYWLLRGMILQYSHDFPGGLQSLAKAAELDPQSPEPIAWQAAIYMVQARYREALSECTRLVPLAHPLYAQGCTAYVEASTGHLADAYRGLERELAAAGEVAPELALWIQTRLADMAVRLQRTGEAQAHFDEALKLGVTDQYLLGAYADFLLLQQRPAEAIKLLADWERSDILLLRLALAGKAAKDPRAAGWADQLRDRFAAATLRGDRLHEQEAARFELDVEGHPDKALNLAVRTYQTQKEARDAEILLRAALAAKQPKAAQPALDWLRSTGYEDPPMAQLADQLVAQGARR